MRKKLDTRFPASRIKKIMQADEDVGKIALAVPVLVSKALELFLQDLCDRTYDITLQRGVKTMSSLHLKQCIHNFNVFDFLKDVVSKVPDLGGSDAAGDDKSSKRRRAADDGNESDEDSKRFKTEVAAGQNSSASARGRGRGRGRGRPRGSGRGGDRDSARYDRFEDDPGTSPQHNDIKLNDIKQSEYILDAIEGKEAVSDMSGRSTGIVHNFDLNLDLDENGDTPEAAPMNTVSAPAADHHPEAASMNTALAPAADHRPEADPMNTVSGPVADHRDPKHEEDAALPLSEVDKMRLDPLKLSLLNNRIEEEDEDYDNEDS